MYENSEFNYPRPSEDKLGHAKKVLAKALELLNESEDYSSIWEGWCFNRASSVTVVEPVG